MTWKLCAKFLSADFETYSLYLTTPVTSTSLDAFSTVVSIDTSPTVPNQSYIIKSMIANTNTIILFSMIQIS